MIEVPRDHYGWQTVDDPFYYQVLCLQETNLIRFLETNCSETISTALEVGAASDIFLRRIPAEHRIGVNVLQACIDQLEAKGVDGRLSNGHGIPANDGEADLTICFETLEHVPDPIGFLRELARVTSDNGRILLSIPNVPKTVVRGYHHGVETPVDQPESEYHIFEFDRNDFRKVVTHAGLEIQDEQVLVNFSLCYDPISNRCIRRHVSPDCFDSLQAYTIIKKR